MAATNSANSSNNEAITPEYIKKVYESVSQIPSAVVANTKQQRIGNIAGDILETAGNIWGTKHSLLGDALNAVHQSIQRTNSNFSDPFLFTSALAAGHKAAGAIASSLGKLGGNIVKSVVGGNALSANQQAARNAELAQYAYNISGGKIGSSGQQAYNIRMMNSPSSSIKLFSSLLNR